MLEQDTDCHVVNTASMAGFESSLGKAIYKVTKHGVVSLSETLYHELAHRGAKVGVSVLCPGWVNTRILESALERRRRSQGDTAARDLSPERQARNAEYLEAFRAGMAPAQVARLAFSAIREGKFYILTHPEFKGELRRRFREILDERNPALS
jgi:short-subunit dehydrogenase